MCLKKSLLVTAGLLAGGCAKNSAAVVDGDPFQTHAAAIASHAASESIAPAATAPAATAQLPDAPAATVTTINVAELQNSPPDKAEWWNSLPTAPEAAESGIKVPAASSVQGRVGHASVSYGMGQIAKP